MTDFNTIWNEAADFYRDLDRFNALWNKAVNLYRALERKGTLVLSGSSPEIEVAYVYYDDFVTLAVGETAELAVQALIDKLSQEAQQQAQDIIAEATEKASKLTSHFTSS